MSTNAAPGSWTRPAPPTGPGSGENGWIGAGYAPPNAYIVMRVCVVKVRLWERDISGLQDEIADLSMNRSLALARIQANLTGLVGAYMPEGGLERVASDLLRPGALSVVSGDASDGIEALETSSGLSDKKSEE